MCASRLKNVDLINTHSIKSIIYSTLISDGCSRVQRTNFLVLLMCPLFYFFNPHRAPASILPEPTHTPRPSPRSPAPPCPAPPPTLCTGPSSLPSGRCPTMSERCLCVHVWTCTFPCHRPALGCFHVRRHYGHGHGHGHGRQSPT